MERVAGVDGCRGGWVGAVWDDSGVEWRALPLAFAEMLAVLNDCAVVAVDVPIGVVETGFRPCDEAARKALGTARSRVFMVPVRAVLDAPDHKAACVLAKETEGWAPSIQTWQIGARIRDATAWATSRDTGPVVVEAHPEASFLQLSGRVLESKHSARGLAERVDVLGKEFGNVTALLAGAPRAATADDALDALACAWTARRVLDGEAVPYGTEPLVIRA